ncbi:MAG TPA: response regulator [Myxococcota bacterium]|nr:response regulator [Myxococcota bacterium]
MTRKPVVLVVDDEPANRTTLRLMLQADSEVITASSGDEALHLAAERRPVLVLADHKMPGMSGVELLARLRDKHPGCVRMLITAYADRDTLEEAINRAGVYRFVKRPADPAMLRLDILRALEHRASIEAAQRQERLHILGRLAASVGHDLNNYLCPVLAAPAELRSGDAELVSEAISTLEYAAVHLQALSAEMRSIGRGKAPRYQHVSAHLEDTVEGALALCVGGPYTGIVLARSYEPSLPEMRLCTGRIARLVTNLVKNAAEAAGPGGRVEVRVRRDQDLILLEVEDDGPGIPEEHRGQVFDANFTTKDAGVGLGLAICQMIVAGHSGHLELGPGTLGGALFVARLPV